MGAGPYCVTHRRKVHLRTCIHAQRIAFPNPWSPGVLRRADSACETCLDGLLPTDPDLRALLASPTNDSPRERAAETNEEGLA